MNSSEVSPLLPSLRAPSTATVLSGDRSCNPRPPKPSWTRIVVLLLLYLVFLDLGYELIVPAQTRVFEQIVCSLYYDDHSHNPVDIDGRGGTAEKWCKVTPVQSGVALLKGWQLTFDSIGMLVFSVPWAYIADYYGRKPVMLLVSMALFGKYVFVQFICYLQGTVPLRWTWFSAIHTVFGGSVTVGTALIYTIVSDVVLEEKRVAVFFQVLTATITTQFLGSLMSAALMSWDPWIPMLLGLAVELMAIVTLLFIPETKGYRTTDSLAPSLSPAMIQDSQHRIPPWQALRHSRNFLSFLSSDRRIPIILSTFTIHMLFLNRDVLLQYISTRYKISLAQATALVSIRSGAVILTCVIILPVISLYCRSRLGSCRSDLFLARISAVIMVFTFLGIGLAPSLPVLVSALTLNALGWGLWSFLRSLMTSLVEANNVARLNTFIGIFDAVGLMIGSPLLAELFSKGIDLRGYLFGLPFIVCAGVVTLFLFFLLAIRG